MRLFQTQPKDKEKAALRERVDNGEAIKAMMETEGWQIVKSLFDEQLTAYQKDTMLNCKTWDDYQEKRGKVFGMQLILTDIDDFIRQGEQAREKLDN